MALSGSTGAPGKKRAAKSAKASKADGELPAGKRLETPDEVDARYRETIVAARAKLGHPSRLPASAAAEAERAAHAAFDSTPRLIDA